MVGKRRWAGVVVALDCPMTSSTGFSCPIVCSQHLRPRPSSGWLGAGGGGGGDALLCGLGHVALARRHPAAMHYGSEPLATKEL